MTTDLPGLVGLSSIWSKVLFLLSLFLPVEAIVEFDYQAQHDDELTISVGEIITNIRKEDGGWWEGQINGRRGLFPDNFVRVSTTWNPFPVSCVGSTDQSFGGTWGISWALLRDELMVWPLACYQEEHVELCTSYLETHFEITFLRPRMSSL